MSTALQAACGAQHHQLSGAGLHFVLIGLICKQCKQPFCMLPQLACHHAVEACVDQLCCLPASAAQRHIRNTSVSSYLCCLGDFWHGDCVFAGVKDIMISTRWAAVLPKDPISRLMLVDEQTCSMLTHTYVWLYR